MLPSLKNNQYMWNTGRRKIDFYHIRSNDGLCPKVWYWFLPYLGLWLRLMVFDCNDMIRCSMCYWKLVSNAFIRHRPFYWKGWGLRFFKENYPKLFEFFFFISKLFLRAFLFPSLPERTKNTPFKCKKNIMIQLLTGHKSHDLGNTEPTSLPTKQRNIL
jgi:hypothetical protein